MIVHQGDYVVYAVSPIKVDPKDSLMLQKMSEYICRANYGLNCGNFELDYNDGEIRYKCYVSCEGDAVPTVEIIRESFFVLQICLIVIQQAFLGSFFRTGRQRTLSTNVKISKRKSETC